MNAWMLPNSVASNKRPSPSIESALFMINARALNRMLKVYSMASNNRGGAGGQNLGHIYIIQ